MALNKGGYQLIDCDGQSVEYGIILYLDRDVFHTILDCAKPVYFVNFSYAGSYGNAVIKDYFNHVGGDDVYNEYEDYVGTAGGGKFELVGQITFDTETHEEVGWTLNINEIIGT